MPTDPPSAPDLLREVYGAFAGVLREVGEEQSWLPTGCRGWAVRDLTHHALSDAQRALVALHTPSLEEPDRDAVTYWQDWAPDAAGAAQGRRHTRVLASMFLDWDQLRGLYLETALAVVEAAATTEPGRWVATQGHVLRVADLLSTLSVEATVHHLDLTTDLPAARPPSPAGLREVRRVLDGLLGRPADAAWDDERYALVATGRAEPDEEESRRLGALRDRLPVFS
jgi:mycothiol maleylpyruvate isomerase-like protein